MKNIVKFLILLGSFSAFADDQIVEAFNTTSECEVLLSIEHQLTHTGIFRMIDLNFASRLSKVKAYNYMNIKQLMADEFPELELSFDDKLLALDIRGDKQGYLRNLAVSSLSRAASDIVGLHVMTLTYRRSPVSERPTPKVIIVLKDKVTDYRETDARLQTRSEFVSWVSVHLEEMVLNLIQQRTFSMMPGDPSFEMAYDLFAKSPSNDSKLSRSEFSKAFQIAFAKLQNGLTALDLLYFRPSFWDANPAPDDFAKEAYAHMTQQTTEVFEKGFKDRVLSFRNKLYELIHEKPLRAYFNFATRPAEPSVSIHSSAPRGDADIAFSGLSAQQIFGTDFQSGPHHQFQTLQGLTDVFGGDMSHILEALENHGYTEMTQLQGAAAEDLISRCNFHFVEFKRLAEALAGNGIYFRYSGSIYRRMTYQERMLLTPPRNKVFMWDPVKKRWYLKKKD